MSASTPSDAISLRGGRGVLAGSQETDINPNPLEHRGGGGDGGRVAGGDGVSCVCVLSV